jgi:hypothetical protein
MRLIGIPFAGKLWFKITVLGIAKSVICAGIGENGTAKSAINAPMVLHCLVRIVERQIMMTILLTERILSICGQANKRIEQTTKAKPIFL